MLCTVLLAVVSRSSRGITLHLTNDFQDGSTQGWSGSPTVNTPDSGPLGIGDYALEVQSGLSGGQRTVTLNSAAEWKGNYLAAGVTSILLDVQNLNTFALELRIGIAGPLGVGPFGRGDTYVTNYSLNVPSDGEWHSLEFSITPTDFDAADSNTNPNANIVTALEDVTQIRILHNPTGRDFRGAPDGGTWGLDNIRTIPEPSAGAMASLSWVAQLLTYRRRPPMARAKR